MRRDLEEGAMRRQVAAGTLAGLTLLVAACGGGGSKKSSSVSANGTATTSASSGSSSGSGGSGGSDDLTKAISSVGSDGSGSVTLSLFGAASDFNALGGTKSPISAKDEALADKLIGNSSVSISFQKGSSGGSEIDVMIGGEDKAVDIILDKGTLYAKVDVKGIGAATGADTSKLTGEASSVEAEFPWVSSLLAGNYVSVQLAQLKGLAKQFGGLTPTTVAGGTTPTKGQEEQMIQDLKNALTQNTQVSKLGKDAVGQEYAIVVQPRTLVQALESEASSLSGPLSSELGKETGDLSKIPNTPVTLDAWVSGGKLKQVELDFRQFHQGAGGPANPVGLKVAFASLSGSINAPSGATPVDLSKLSSLFGGLAGAGSQ
jgi:hypothetical protein